MPFRDKNGGNEPSSCDFWQVSRAGSILANQACTVSARHIQDGVLRLQFNREVAYYARSIVHDVEQGRKSPEQGLRDLEDEQKSLLEQSLEIAQKGVGVVAGVLQFAAGAGICYGSVGTLCLVAGAPLMAHGANNTYETARNLWEDRTDTQGPVRKGYHEVSKVMGGDEFEGNMAYGGADLLMSAYGLGRLVLKPDSWRLFRYVRGDYQRAYINTSKQAFAVDMTADGFTMGSMYKETAEDGR
ncbi:MULTISPECIES: DUF4225 domain-containing protein [Pseudomonas]|uniref:DUF4225 domain-containing protein n=2 Tax=Pseudomonas TaxID=286 RepID=A0A4Y9TC27_PSEFL|nr:MULTISPECIES: DUF4225 domain-containing protein [Pseudomonas]CRM91548.1 hypothetical protein [Pseudomonas sp. 22 E 5]MCX9153634.1 DUF4225 domain-containing protein [Pseudomonas sp. TB1-B1]QXH68881.1 DUF4225 domain-containing protein [Pseudomonas asgharzadehiana]TFW41973.1 DUF4225 domain-containing protein [Pseudomonas fluorescens]TKJ64078.1 DUF4225 domain-containing protein [Pseudomonas sp. CFBP13506]